MYVCTYVYIQTYTYTCLYMYTLLPKIFVGITASECSMGRAIYK